MYIQKKLMIYFEYVIRTSNSHEPYKELHWLHRLTRDFICQFSGFSFKTATVWIIQLLLSVPFLQLEWGRLCSDISFWAVKQVLATRSQLRACILNWMDYRQIDWMWFRADWAVLTKERKIIFFVIWTRLRALRLVSLTCEHSLLSSLLSARNVLVLRCQWCARVRWDQEKNSFRGTERRVHERCTDSGRSNLYRRDPQVAATICFTHFLFIF